MEPGFNLHKVQSQKAQLYRLRFIYKLVERNKEYSNLIDPLKKSLIRLDHENNYERAITKHFQNCLDYGFTVIRGI